MTCWPSKRRLPVSCQGEVLEKDMVKALLGAVVIAVVPPSEALLPAASLDAMLSVEQIFQTR